MEKLRFVWQIKSDSCCEDRDVIVLLPDEDADQFSGQFDGKHEEDEEANFDQILLIEICLPTRTS